MPALANESQRITTALLLAAGTGSRLQPLTDDAPKCLTKVNGITILERLVEGLCTSGIERLIVVVGYLEHCIRECLSSLNADLSIEYVSNPIYRTTNNIYSLWAARNAIREPFLLVESDLVVDAALLDSMMYPGKIGVSRMLPWMNGTTVTIDRTNRVTCFHEGIHSALDKTKYKTVNMYSLSLPAWQRVTKLLEHYVSAGRVNGFYETVFAEMAAKGSLSLEAVFFDNARWYEIDTLEDLRQAERLFSNGHSKPRSDMELQDSLSFSPRPVGDTAGRDERIHSAP